MGNGALRDHVGEALGGSRVRLRPLFIDGYDKTQLVARKLLGIKAPPTGQAESHGNRWQHVGKFHFRNLFGAYAFSAKSAARNKMKACALEESTTESHASRNGCPS